MRFSPTFLDDIRERVLISDVIGKRVAWERRKTNAARGDWWACCPFHGEKTPSFHCEDRKGRYHCFGCGVSGDHFRFLVELEGLSFPEAVERVAEMAGVPMPAFDPQEARREKERASLTDVMEMATVFFQEQLHSATGAKARAYLRERGLTGRTIETFRLGYAPDGRNALKEHLAARNVEKEQIEACGLVVFGPDIPVSYDRFRDRVMFPILSSRDKVIAFGGRALSPDAPAKYLNSNETELFHKGNVLYNFARARRTLQGAGSADTVIAVEGYMDVIALHQVGVENVVAPLGTALTENQLELMWRMTPQPVLCFDGDTAGVRAANRAVDLALPGIRPGRSVRFAMLPEGKDPDDLVRHEGRGPFDAVLAAARPLADMVWSREAGAGTFDTPERRAELEARLKTVTNAIGDESVRRHYGQEMRERLNAFFDTGGPQRGRDGYGRRGGNGRDFRSGAGGGSRFGAAGGAQTARRYAVSEQLSRSGLVAGHAALPPLRESMLVLTVVNHPQLLHDEFDEAVSLDFDNREVARLWTAVLDFAGEDVAIASEVIARQLVEAGFADLLSALDRQIRNARIWTATDEAAIEDARDGFLQALNLHKRTRALRWQKAELEREIAETEDADAMDRLMGTLNAVKLEEKRLESQEAIIDGFGVMSGRAKGPARA